MIGRGKARTSAEIKFAFKLSTAIHSFVIGSRFKGALLLKHCFCGASVFADLSTNIFYALYGPENVLIWDIFSEKRKTSIAYVVLRAFCSF